MGDEEAESAPLDIWKTAVKRGRAGLPPSSKPPGVRLQPELLPLAETDHRPPLRCMLSPKGTPKQRTEKEKHTSDA